MDPALIGSDDWQWLTRILNDLYVATGLGVTAAMAFLLAHGIIPSLVATADVAPELRGLRWLFYPIAAVALALTCFALVRVFSQSVVFLDQFYPRYGY
jgi:hypothetical protein